MLSALYCLGTGSLHHSLYYILLFSSETIHHRFRKIKMCTQFYSLLLLVYTGWLIWSAYQFVLQNKVEFYVTRFSFKLEIKIATKQGSSTFQECNKYLLSLSISGSWINFDHAVCPSHLCRHLTPPLLALQCFRYMFVPLSEWLEQNRLSGKTKTELADKLRKRWL